MDFILRLPWPPGFEIAGPSIALGLIVGLSYAVLALGLVLVYRATRVINLAHGEIGAFAAALLALLVGNWNVPYPVALIAALATAAVLGAVVEMTVIRRLSRSPRLLVLVATLGLAQLFLLFTFLLIDMVESKGAGHPVPFDLSVGFGRLLVLSPSHLMILFIVPVVTVVLTLFFRRSTFGLAIRASAENEQSARLVGIRTRRVSTFVWTLAAALAGLTAVSMSAGEALVATETLGPGLLVRALAAAVVGRLRSLPVTFAAGIGIGVVESVVFWNYPRGGLVSFVLFGVILVALLLQTRGGFREEQESSWALVQVFRPIPRRLRELRVVRRLGWGVSLALFAAAAGLPFLLSNAQTFLLTTVVAFAILALSVTLLTGYAGQLSLGQAGFFGLGAAVSYQLVVQAGVAFPLAVAVAGLAGAAASILIGVPALRIRGLMLAVTTLGFAVVMQGWLLGQDWMLGVGVIAPRPSLGPVAVTSQRGYYLVALTGLALAAWVTRNLVRGGYGRNFVAVRENEPSAATFSVSPVRTKLIAFAVSGFLAAFAGAIYGHGLQRISIANFPVTDGLRVVAMTIIGGLGSIPGAIAGAAFVIGVDRLVPVPFLRFLTTSVGLLVLLMYLPGGLGTVIYKVRDWVLDRIDAPVGQPAAGPGPVSSQEAREDGAPLLRALGDRGE